MQRGEGTIEVRDNSHHKVLWELYSGLRRCRQLLDACSVSPYIKSEPQDFVALCAILFVSLAGIGLVLSGTDSTIHTSPCLPSPPRCLTVSPTPLSVTHPSPRK